MLNKLFWPSKLLFSIQPRASNGTADHSSEYWVGGILPKIGKQQKCENFFYIEMYNKAGSALKLKCRKRRNV